MHKTKIFNVTSQYYLVSTEEILYPQNGSHLFKCIKHSFIAFKCPADSRETLFHMIESRYSPISWIAMKKNRQIQKRNLSTVSSRWVPRLNGQCDVNDRQKVKSFMNKGSGCLHTSEGKNCSKCYSVTTSFRSSTDLS